ncbi:MAG: T9SS type A sorting domain-containing protein [Flavobacteriaceae bacterium]
MKNKLLVFLLFPIAVLAQTQIGQNIFPELYNEHSGWSVAISSDGQTVASAAQPVEIDGVFFSRVRVYVFDGQDYMQIGQTLEIENYESPYTWIKGRVSLSADGNILAMSTPFYGPSERDGITKIFQYNGTEWQQLGQDILGEEEELKGYSISLSADGMIAAILSYGSAYNPNSYYGNLTVYQYNGTDWEQLGQKLEGYSVTNAYYSFAMGSVSLSNDGTRMVVGMPHTYSAPSPPGEVWAYEYTETSWELLGQPILNDGQYALYAWDVDLSGDGNTIAIGSHPINGPGIAKMVELIDDQWIQKGERVFGDQEGDYFGTSVSLSDNGTIVAVGAPLANNSTSYFEGYTSIYKFTGTDWSQLGTPIYGNNEYDYSGFEVALSAVGDILAVGTPNFTNEPFTNSGVVRVYGLAGILSTESYVNHHFSVYPNPAQESLRILLDNDVQLIEASIYNSVGQFIKKEFKTTIDIAELASGTYYIQLVSDKGKHTTNFVKK